MENRYCIIHNPLIFELMEFVHHENATVFDLLSFLTGRPSDALSHENYTDYLAFNIEKERKGLLEYSGMEFYASYYIANQITAADKALKVYICDGKRRTIKKIIELEKEKPLAVFISSLSANFPATVLTSIVLNYGNIPVIIGGIHISTQPEDAETFIRKNVPHPELISTVKGPGDRKIITDILKDIKNNTLKPFYQGITSIENMVWGHPNVISPPRQEVAYLKKFSVIGDYLSRKVSARVTTPYLGCPYSCTFCSISTLPKNQRKFISREVDDFLNEIHYYQKEGTSLSNRYFMFLPDNLLLGGKKLEAVLDRMIENPIKINYAAQISIDVAKRPALLKKLRLSGATHFLIGFESLNLKNLEFIGKNILKELEASGLTVQEYYAKQIKIIQAQGISIIGAFIFGLPYDHFRSLSDHSGKEIIAFCLKNKIGIQASCLNDLPGSINFNLSQKENTTLYGKAGTMAYLSALCASDLTEVNRKLSDSLKRSPLVATYMAYDTIMHTNKETTILKHALSLTGSVLKSPTEKAKKDLKEKGYDVLGLFGCMLGQCGYKDHFRELVSSQKNRTGIFERLYKTEKDPEIKKMFKPYIKNFMMN